MNRSLKAMLYAASGIVMLAPVVAQADHVTIEDIQPRVVTLPTDTLFEGEQRIVDEGTAGKRYIITHEYTVKGKKKISKINRVLKRAKDKIVYVGTKKRVQTEQKPKLIVPMYKYPEKGNPFWETVIQSDLDMLVIVNPASGPKDLSKNYQWAVGELRAHQKDMIGYIATNYGEKSLEQMKAEVDKYYEIIPDIKGFFLDEFAHKSDKDVWKYKELHQYIKARNGLIVGNPGTSIRIPELYNYVDIAMTAEYPQDHYLSYNWNKRTPFELDVNNKDRIAHIIYDIKDINMVLSNLKNARWFYLTDDGGSNPYDTLPSFWTVLNEKFSKKNS